MTAVPQSVRLKAEHRGAIAEHEWYREPKWAVDALIDAEDFSGTVYDPCCGSGTVPDAFVDRGFEAYGSDIVDRADGRFGQENFFDRTACGERFDNIVSNPPFTMLLPFIDRALALANRKVCVLARLAFLETPPRKGFFLTRPLARVLVFSKRVSMPPAGKGIPEKGGTVAFAWFVFDKAYHGPNGQVLPPVLGWVP